MLSLCFISFDTFRFCPYLGNLTTPLLHFATLCGAKLNKTLWHAKCFVECMQSTPQKAIAGRAFLTAVGVSKTTDLLSYDARSFFCPYNHTNVRLDYLTKKNSEGIVVLVVS